MIEGETVLWGGRFPILIVLLNIFFEYNMYI